MQKILSLFDIVKRIFSKQCLRYWKYSLASFRHGFKTSRFLWDVLRFHRATVCSVTEYQDCINTFSYHLLRLSDSSNHVLWFERVQKVFANHQTKSFRSAVNTSRTIVTHHLRINKSSCNMWRMVSISVDCIWMIWRWSKYNNSIRRSMICRMCTIFESPDIVLFSIDSRSAAKRAAYSYMHKVVPYIHYPECVF